MVKIDVPDYYMHAADNIDAVVKLIADAAKEGPKEFKDDHSIKASLVTGDFQGTLEYLAMVMGLPEGDSLNDFAQALSNRHQVRGEMQGLWYAFRTLPKDSPHRTKMHSLLTKAKNVSYADLYEKYPEMK